MAGQLDLNLPRSTWSRAGSFLQEFFDWMQATQKVAVWRVAKNEGGHLTNFWVYALLDGVRASRIGRRGNPPPRPCLQKLVLCRSVQQ